jgi:hypothetical protein
MLQTILMNMAGERRGNNFKVCKDFNLKAMARIWP